MIPNIFDVPRKTLAKRFSLLYYFIYQLPIVRMDTKTKPPSFVFISLKLHASNRARADYDGRFECQLDSTQSMIFEFKFLKLGDKKTGELATVLTLIFFMANSRKMNLAYGI